MNEPTHDFINTGERGSWIRLRTLIFLRWVAIVGQISALVIAQQRYSLTLNTTLCYLVVGASVVGILAAMLRFPENHRVSERENLLMVMFDLLQLAALLYLTGGLHNPFSILIIGPVTVSVTALSLRSTVLLGALAIALVSFLAIYHLPLRTEHGFILHIPQIFVFGNWVSIVIAIVFLGIYSRWTSNEVHSMSDALQATQMALAREQKLTDLGGVVAAAAHELGTPLATIKLTSAELIEDLSDAPDMLEDAQLIHEQADRCRDILRSMGRAGKDDLHLHQAPLSAVIGEAADPHKERGRTLHFDMQDSGSDPLSVLRRPEIIHGLRNLVQNAVDFSRENVWIAATWDESNVTVQIQDDGKGYPAHLFGRLGDPFMGRRRNPKEKRQRPGYEGMGLGLFIAKTLLERSNAKLFFANGTNSDTDKLRTGAHVTVIWPRSKIDAQTGEFAVPIGPNQPIGHS